MAEITVVVPAFNAARFVEQTLNSVLSQDFDDLELIVVDDGSIDGTREVLESFASQDRRVVVVTQTNQGVSAARNAGLKAAAPSTYAILFLDHDDVLLPGALTRLYQALSSCPGASAAHAIATVIDESGAAIAIADPKALGLNRWRLADGQSLLATIKIGAVPMPQSEPTTFAALTYTSCITSPGQALVRQSALQQTGGFDPATAPSDDWDLFLRLSRVGPIAYLPEPVLGWRQHEHNESRDIEKMKRSSFAVRSKLIAGPPKLTSSELAAVRKQFAYTAAAVTMAAIRRNDNIGIMSDVVPAISLWLRSMVTMASG